MICSQGPFCIGTPSLIREDAEASSEKNPSHCFVFSIILFPLTSQALT